jgi:hypothetical protein
MASVDSYTKRIRELESERKKNLRQAKRARERRRKALRQGRWKDARSSRRTATRNNKFAQENRREIRRLRKERKRAEKRKAGAIAGTSFTWGEAKAKSWYPILPSRLKAPVERHAKNLERLRDEITKARRKHGLAPTGIHILSWVRSPLKNRAIGGASQSRHMSGDATDISREEVARLCPWNPREFDAIANRVFANGGFGQYPGGSRHVDSRGYRSRWTSF